MSSLIYALAGVALSACGIAVLYALHPNHRRRLNRAIRWLTVPLAVTVPFLAGSPGDSWFWFILGFFGGTAALSVAMARIRGHSYRPE